MDREAWQAILRGVAKSPTRHGNRERVRTKSSPFLENGVPIPAQTNWTSTPGGKSHAAFSHGNKKFMGSETIFPPRMVVCAVRLFATLRTVACQTPLAIEFFRQEYWSGLPCPPPGDLPNGKMVSVSLLLHWQAGPLPLAPPWEATFRGLLFLIVISFQVRPHRHDVWCVNSG